MAKRGRNLAALAALGALGYEYINRGDKQKGSNVFVSDAVRAKNEDERDGTTSAAAPAAAPARNRSIGSIALDLGKIVAEDGAVSGSRRNTESGDLYTPLAAKDLKAYEDRQKLINANVNNPGYGPGMKNGGMTASKRADGCAQRGKTRGKMV